MFDVNCLEPEALLTLKPQRQLHFQMVDFQVKWNEICRNAEEKAVIVLCVKCVTCELGDTTFYIAMVRVDPNRSQSPLAFLLHKAIARDCSCVLKAKWTRSICFSDGELRCGDDATNRGAAESN